MELRVVRVTDRFDEACRFYGEVLGWPVTKEWTDGGRGRMFGYGESARIELLEGTPEPVSGLFVAAEVDDLGETLERLRAAGLTLLQEPAVQPWGHRNLAVIDPTGVKLVLFQVL
jgi:lactoylglutathione lyase